MNSLALRDAHAQGPTRVSISGHHILTGGANGVVSLFSSRQWPKAGALWSFNCHEGAVTDVVLAEPLALAISCGRDGRILLHENILDTAKLISRVICQVTGEVRCLQLDAEHRRVYIAGDSLRCLDMTQERFKIHTIPLVVPFPIVALAVSPCGLFIAMGSASGELGVVSVPPFVAAAAGGEGEQAAAASVKAQFVFRSVLSPTAKRDDAVHYRLSWCSTKAGGLQLMVPTATEVQVYQLDAASSTGAPQMRAIGGLHDRDLVDLHAALVYRVSQGKLACLMASRDGLFIGKVEAKSLAMSRHTSERYGAQTGGAAVTDVRVNSMNGDVVVGLSDGRISLLRKAALKEWKAGAAAAADGTAAAGAESATNADDDEEAEGQRQNEERRGNAVSAPANQSGALKPRDAQRRSRKQSNLIVDDEDDDGFINDNDDSDDGSDSESSVSSSSSASSSSSSADSSDSGVAPEDFGRVVKDLQRSGASVHANDEERPSRWRDDDAQAALAHAEREAERQRTRSRFLDDEAEEGSAEEEEEEDEDGATRRPQRAAYAAEYEEADADDNRDDGASVEGHAEEDESDNDGGALRADAVTQRLRAARMPAVQDYSFQVGATPAGEGGSCYLAYNSVGYIHCSREATTIHFHDIAFPAVRMQLRDTVLMGTLSPVGAGFIVLPADAADAQGSVDEAPRLTVLYHAFTPLGAQSEWRVSLLPGETVRCMAAGIRFLAVSTSHYLRIFSLSGLELAVLSKCQRIVTMVGTSSRKLMSSFKADFDPLAVVTLTGTGELQMEVMDVGARAAALPARTIPLTELPDGSTHQLQWLGWSEDGLLHTVDTAGVVRMFTEDWGGAWVPVYDPRTLVDQSYALWVYGVSDSALLAYRYSRDEPSYPAAAASGLTTELVPLFLPLTRTMGEEGRERWDKVLRQQLRCDELKRHSAFYSATIAKYDELHDHHLLQFFDAALKEQQTTRALELAMLMEIHDRIVKCAQLANNGGYAKLVPKLLALYEMRMAGKNKRRCTLPLKEALTAEKKKDELLRKLLGQMQPQDKKGKASDSPAAEGTASGGAVAAHTDATTSSSSTPSPAVEKAAGATPPRVPPAAVAVSPSAASTATTVGADGAEVASAASTAARRHITFAHESAPPSLSQASTVTTTQATTTAMTAGSSVAASAGRAAEPQGPRKVLNPFARPAPAAAAPTPSAEAKATSAAPPASATATGAGHPTRPHSAAPASATARQTTLLGASQGSTPPRTTMLTARGSATAAPVPLSPPSLIGGDGEAATDPDSLGTTPDGARVSAGRTATSPPHLTSASDTVSGGEDHAEVRKGLQSPAMRATADNGVEGKREDSSAVSAASRVAAAGGGGGPAFVPRELPTRSSGPVDPFLAGAPSTTAACAASSAFRLTGGSAGGAFDSVYGGTAEEAPSVSVQALLDEGHSETAPVVRSNSFGEALRKRYRDDDEDDEEGLMAPVAVVPKLAL